LRGINDDIVFAWVKASSSAFTSLT
jgi:hypothetical protein